MSQSTPLNQLPKQNSLNMEQQMPQQSPPPPVENNLANQTDNDLVNEILNEMEPMSPQNDMNADLLNHSMDFTNSSRKN